MVILLGLWLLINEGISKLVLVGLLEENILLWRLFEGIELSILEVVLCKAI